MFSVNSWIMQTIWQWTPDCWSGDRKARLPNLLRQTHERNRRCGNLRHGQTVVGVIPGSTVA